MIREDYVSYEIAKLLKEKGFNVELQCYSYDAVTKENVNIYWQKNINGLLPRCTHQLAMKWLRVKHNIHIAVDRGIEHYFAVLTKLKPYQDLTMKNDVFDTYEEAVEAALKYCLTKLI